MKMAVAHFQCAAWAFHALPDKFPQESDSDMSSEVLAFKSGLCLAQVNTNESLTFKQIIVILLFYLVLGTRVYP